MKFKNISKFNQIAKNDDKLTIYSIKAKIVEITRLQNMTIIIADDGVTTFKLVKYIPGVSPYPELIVGCIVEFSFKLNNYQNEVQGQIADIKNVIFPKQEEKMEISNKLEQNNFFNKGNWNKLNEMLEKTSKVINDAILDKRPIILSHHADCDGYTSAYILEKAIIKKILKRQPTLKNLNLYYTRNASKTPFYDISDATKDISFFQSNMQRVDNKFPLIIIMDNGSTYEDILAIEKVKIFGAEVVVVDHHHPGKIENGKSEVCNLVKSHLNPHLVDLKNQFSTSMVSLALAHYIDKEIELEYFSAALGAVADKCEGEEIEELIRLSGENKEYLTRISKIVALEVFFTKYAYGSLPIFDLLSKPNKIQKDLLELYEKYFSSEETEINSMLNKYVQKNNWNKYEVNILDADKLTLWNDFFSIGKITGYFHNNLKNTKQNENFITIGLSDSMIVYRINQLDGGFDGNKLVSWLKQSMPYARVSGGGHDVAGSIRFVPASKEEIIFKVKEFILNI